MTRFARAKGSKASNERREEDATPWHVMRQQLANQLSNGDVNSSAKDLSQIVKNVTSSELEHRNEIWSDFGEHKHISVKNKKGNIIKNEESKTKNKKKFKLIDSSVTNDHDFGEIKPISVKSKKENIIKNEQSKTKNKKKSKLVDSNVTDDKSRTEPDSQKQTLHKLKIGKKLNVKSQSNKKCSKLNKRDNHGFKNIETSEKDIEKDTISDKSSLDNFSSNNSSQNDLKKKTEVKSQKPKYSQKNYKGNNSIYPKNLNQSSPYTIIANGREIRIVRYDGFLIKKDDAERLKNLRRKLKSQNISSEKIKAIMKLERRKAEKALAREKNTVCFHCRKFGHNFADCPEIKESEASKSGMCFKCGSTEHTHFQCKVSQNQNFRYAVCFVCKEQGHIARQCTLNPQGQYPKGGSCHLCGEVTHLRKDCPQAVEEKPLKTLTVNRLKSCQLEDLDESELYKKNSDQKKKKLVKF